MLDWLKDHWEFLVGVAIGLPGLVALWYQRRPNTLDYRILPTTPLLNSAHANLADPLTVNHRGKPMRNPCLLRARIVNTGKHAVRADDYATPLIVETHGCKVYHVSTIRESVDGILDRPADIEVVGAADDEFEDINIVKFRPALLNPGDWFEIHQLTEGSPSATEIKCRYAGQSRPMRPLTSESETSDMFIWIFIQFAFSLIALVYFLQAGITQWSALIFVPGFTMLQLWFRTMSEPYGQWPSGARNVALRSERD